MASTTAASSSPVFPPHAGEEPVPLSRLPVGWRRVVLRVDGPDQAELAREGVHPDRIVVVTARTPLAGPLVVEVGGSRVALSSRVASQVLTRAITPSDSLVP